MEGRLRSSVSDYFRKANHHSRLWQPWWTVFLHFLSPAKRQQRQKAFFVAIFSMLAKLAKADNLVTRDEIEIIEHFIDRELRLNTQQKLFALQVFRTAKTSSTSFSHYAQQYHKLFRGNVTMLENAIDILLSVSHGDGKHCFEEDRLLRIAVEIFDLSKEHYEHLKSFHKFREAKYERKASEQSSRKYGSRSTREHASRDEPLNQAYRILGCTASETDISIKKKYRKLVLKYHPDRQTAQGVPEGMRKVSEQKFRQIQEAYEAVVLQRREK